MAGQELERKGGITAVVNKGETAPQDRYLTLRTELGEVGITEDEYKQLRRGLVRRSVAMIVSPGVQKAGYTLDEIIGIGEHLGVSPDEVREEIASLIERKKLLDTPTLDQLSQKARELERVLTVCRREILVGYNGSVNLDIPDSQSYIEYGVKVEARLLEINVYHHFLARDTEHWGYFDGGGLPPNFNASRHLLSIKVEPSYAKRLYNLLIGIFNKDRMNAGVNVRVDGKPLKKFLGGVVSERNSNPQLAYLKVFALENLERGALEPYRQARDFVATK